MSCIWNPYTSMGRHLFDVQCACFIILHVFVEKSLVNAVVGSFVCWSWLVSWLPVSFLLHVKYTLSCRIVADLRVWICLQMCMWHVQLTATFGHPKDIDYIELQCIHFYMSCKYFYNVQTVVICAWAVKVKQKTRMTMCH